MMYEKSEELVRMLEDAVQREQNESVKSQYQTLLQAQRNTSASLKSLEGINQAQAGQQDNQYGGQNYMGGMEGMRGQQAGQAGQAGQANANQQAQANSYNHTQTNQAQQTQKDANRKATE